jgi:hypothetical protein
MDLHRHDTHSTAPTGLIPQPECIFRLSLIEYPCFPDGNGQDQHVVIAALQPAAGLVELLLSEELGDLT